MLQATRRSAHAGTCCCMTAPYRYSARVVPCCCMTAPYRYSARVVPCCCMTAPYRYSARLVPCRCRTPWHWTLRPCRGRQGCSCRVRLLVGPFWFWRQNYLGQRHWDRFSGGVRTNWVRESALLRLRGVDTTLLPTDRCSSGTTTSLPPPWDNHLSQPPPHTGCAADEAWRVV